MRHASACLILFLGFFINTALFAQTIIIDDDFNDGDFTNNPTWTDHESKHIVNTSNHLQLDAPSESDEAIITTESTAAYGEWEALIELDFNPSGSNLAKFYILSDVENMKNDVQGYFIQIGGTDDEISLYRQDDSGTTEIIDGTDDLVDTNPVSVRVRATRDLDGTWELLADPAGGNSFTSQGTTTDETYSISNYLGLLSDYTSTRSDLFAYDDITVTKVTPPLAIQSADAVDDQTIDVVFNLDIDPASITISDFELNNGVGNPDAVNLSETNVARLEYNSPVSSGKYTLTVDGIDDIDGNRIDPNTTIDFNLFGAFEDGDIIINEFMYDEPDGLEEYVEIKNTSNKYLNLTDWQIADNTSSSSLNATPVPIDPNGLLVLSTDTTVLFNTFGNRNYHKISLPALNNNTDAVQLITDSGVQADSLIYTSDWGGSDVALERRSADASSVFQENWGNSPNPDGGSPGAPNEIAADNTAPELLAIEIPSKQILRLTFDERIGNVGNYDISNSSIATVDQPASSIVELSLGTKLQNAQEYTLSITDTEDTFGNTIGSVDTSFTFYEPSPVDSGDVAINEFMYAPPPVSSEYVELYNHSDKSLDLQDWTLSDNRESFEGTITTSQFIVPPDSFVVITPDNTIKGEYPNIMLVTMSSFPALNNGGDQIVIRDQNGTLLDSLQYSSSWGGDEVALERRTIDVKSTYQSNWNDAPNNFGTPASSNIIEPDQTSPTVEKLSIKSSTELIIIFSEQLNAGIGQDESNYTLSEGPDIDDAQISAPESVLLTLGNSLQDSRTYTISIENITDIFGNSIAPFDTSFTFYDPTPVEPGDIAINEFMYIPSPTSSEYIELYNHSDKSLDLQNWTLSDNRESFEGTITSDQIILPPDNFIVIAPDNTIEEDHPNISLISMSDFPALNNGGDQIIIRDQNSTLLDSLQYNSSWGGDEVAMERRSISIAPTFSENWGEAPNGFGTPGMANEVEPDETPPSFTDFIIENATTFTLVFSENIDPSTATDKQNYQFTPHQNIQLISVHKDTVTLFLDAKLTSGETYEITVSGIVDIFGNTISETKVEEEFLKIEDPDYGDIVINEFLYNPGPNSADFVELYNRSDKNIDLSSWFIGDTSSETSISNNIQLRANSYVVLTGSSILRRLNDNVYSISGFPALNNNTPDAIYLRTESGLTVDSLRFQQNWGGNTEGISLERRDPWGASNDASNWQTNTSENGHSAGTKNITFQEDVDPPEVIFSKVLPDGDIHVQFSEFIRLTEESRFFSDDQELQVARFDSTSANIIILAPQSTQKSAGNNTAITIQNISDVKGNVTSSSEVSLSQPIEPSGLVINEIMFNPLADSDDDQPDQSEYIELRNTRDYAISLEGVVLHDAPDENGDVRTLHPVFTKAKWVPSEGQVLFYADGAAAFEDSKIATFFELSFPDQQSVMRVDRSTLSLASTGDAIYLADSTGAVIDSVFYDEAWHNPNIIDTRGIALERVAPGGPSNDESNWGSSVNKKGGTPNSENSIYQESSDHMEEKGISFTPNPFSPDSDGYEDNLFINYKLDHQDYLIDVQIYDRYGRPVRELADGKQAGFEGQLIWDGRKDDGSRNRIGIYIVVFEAYDSSSGSDQAFKETVVLARELN